MDKNKLYYSNPYIDKFACIVKSCEEKDGKFNVILDQTAFYPIGGGQPSDTGLMGEAFVSYVFEENDEVVHVCDKALSPGEEYSCNINWQKRFDHMQHHSAEHVVTGIIHKLYGADNVGFNIGEDYVTMDYNVFLEAEDIIKIEKLANEAVYKNIPIKINYYEGTPSFEYRSKKELTGTIRIVTIDDFDVCACCGTQLEKTGEIGLIKIISYQKYKSGSRLLMVCGGRALADYQIKENNVKEISALLSVKPADVSKSVKTLFDEKEKMKYENCSLKFKLIEMKCDLMKASEKIIIFEPQLSPEEMRHYINIIMEKCETGSVFSGNDDDGYRYIMSSKKHNIADIAKEMNSLFHGKGGGKGIVQGTFMACQKSLKEYLEKLQ